MPFATVCSTAPQPGKPCDSTSQNPSLFSAFRNLFNSAQPSQPSQQPSQQPSLLSRLPNSQERRIQAAQQYMSARIAGRNSEVLGLVSEDIQLESSRDGHVSGKEAFGDYLDRVKPTGTWSEAKWNAQRDRAEILGNVRILMVNVGVIARFGFDRGGKINHIYVGRKTEQ